MGDTPSQPSEDRLEHAKHYVKMMIFGVETRPKGFDNDGITWLIENFIMMTKVIRGPGDPPTFQHMWTRKTDLRPVPGGKKRTEHLVDTLRRFNHFLIPGDGNAKGMFELYFEIRTQMFELVDGYRRALEAQGNSKEVQKLNQEIANVTLRTKTRDR